MAEFPISAEISKILWDSFRDIWFEEGPGVHRYTNSLGTKFKSVTSLIEEFTHKFDAAKIAPFTAKKLGISVNDTLAMWKDKNDYSKILGTQIHLVMENAWQRKAYHHIFHDKFKYDDIQADFDARIPECLNLYEKLSPRYVPIKNELPVYDVKHSLCGTIDFLCYDTLKSELVIMDWKGLPLDTDIPTPSGFTSMKDLRVGDTVFDKNGDMTKIKAKSSVHYNPCCEIVFSSGGYIIADMDHRWEIRHHGSPEITVMTTAEIMHNISCGDKLEIADALPIKTNTADLPIDPYVLGCWLGESYTEEGHDSSMMDEISSRGYGYDADECTGIGCIYATSPEIANDIASTRCIPMSYQRASYEQRLDLLRGLMDSRGRCIGNQRFSISFSDRTMMESFGSLLCSLGMSDVSINPRESDAFDMSSEYVIDFITDGTMPFLVTNSGIDLSKMHTPHNARIISEVHQTFTYPTQCIEVDSPTHTYLCTGAFIPTHNSNACIDTVPKPYTKKMLHPFENFDDLNFYHYCVQLSAYKAIVECNSNLKIGPLWIFHIPKSGPAQFYKCIDVSEIVKNELLS
jgi:hypothetical protein